MQIPADLDQHTRTVSLCHWDVARPLSLNAGFHLYRSQLDAMPDPELAHAKRGAHWTFDPARFVRCLKQLRGGGILSHSNQPVYKYGKKTLGWQLPLEHYCGVACSNRLEG